MAKPTATKAAPKPTPTAAPVAAAPAPSPKAAATGVTSTKAPTLTVAAKPASSSGCCGGHTACASPTYEQIAQRAYEIWVAKGRPQGQDIDNWKQAETDLKRTTLVSAA